VIAAAEVHS